MNVYQTHREPQEPGWPVEDAQSHLRAVPHKVCADYKRESPTSGGLQQLTPRGEMRGGSRPMMSTETQTTYGVHRHRAGSGSRCGDQQSTAKIEKGNGDDKEMTRKWR